MAVNVAAARAVFAGETGPVRDAVVLNAGAALAAHAGLTTDLLSDVRAGMDRAERALAAGAPSALVRAWAARTPPAAG